MALVVDDDEGVGKISVQALESVGFTAHKAEDGLRGLSIFEQKRPDFVLLDVKMPKMDGIAACAAIRGVPGGRLTPILMMTGLNDIESVNRAFEAGATDFISKPFSPVVLGHRARYLLRAARAFQAAQAAEDYFARLYRDQEEIAGRLLSLMNNVPGVVYRGLRDWTVTFISGEVKKMTGYTPEEIMNTGVIWKNLVLPEDVDKLKTEYRAAVKEQRGVLRVEYRIRHKSGSVRWIGDRRQLLYTPEGDFAYVDGLLLDITERKTMDAALAEEKDLLEVAQRELMIKNDELIDAYSELKSAHAQMLQKEKMASIGLLAAGIAHEINNPWNEIKYKAVLHKELGDLPPVRCWPQQLNQVFMNLIVNAAQAIEPGMTGVEFLELSKQLAPDAIRILLTGYADLNASIDAINRGGAFRYLAKPWNEGELVRTISDAVEWNGLVRKNRKLTRIINRKNEELKQWNALLEKRVHEQTARINEQNGTLSGMNDRLRKSFDDLIVAFSGLIELHDEGENLHSKVVADLAGRMAAAMALPAEEVKAVTVASLLHDIGKIGAPDVILGKRSNRLTPEEHALYAQHPVRGQAAIDAIEELRPAGLLVRHHHERMDGSGFPDRLRGKAIPLGARIIAVADALDRAVASHPGDNALPLGLARVRVGLGSHFDHALFPHLESVAAGVYASARVKPLAVPREFRLKDLEPGMVLARDVRSGTGVLLLRVGTALNAVQIQGLRRYEEIDPFPGGFSILETA